jgi:hypothetical protein
MRKFLPLALIVPMMWKSSLMAQALGRRQCGPNAGAGDGDLDLEPAFVAVEDVATEENLNGEEAVGDGDVEQGLRRQQGADQGVGGVVGEDLDIEVAVGRQAVLLQASLVGEVSSRGWAARPAVRRIRTVDMATR